MHFAFIIQRQQKKKKTTETTEMRWKNWVPTFRRRKLTPFLTPHARSSTKLQSNSKWTKDQHKTQGNIQEPCMTMNFARIS